jgi:hypothetical protein
VNGSWIAQNTDPIVLILAWRDPGACQGPWVSAVEPLCPPGGGHIDMDSSQHSTEGAKHLAHSSTEKRRLSSVMCLCPESLTAQRTAWAAV